MKEPTYKIGDVLYVSDYYDSLFVAIVKSITYDENGITYKLYNGFNDESELSKGITVSLDKEYHSKNDGENFYTILGKIGSIPQD